MKRIHLAEIDSTNIYINKVEENEVLVTTDFQTAGRGQGTNTWESERGQNLLFSMKVDASWLQASRFFLLSMTGALAIKAAVDELADDITLKWPNDIYWKDRKLCGTLIQTSISGKSLQHCIFGVGLNVNQRRFMSDAPNPVSLWQILGREVSRDELLERILHHFSHFCSILKKGDENHIRVLYHDSLYRKTGYYAYEDKDGRFEAEMIGVEVNGHLLLRDRDGREREYEFKELKYII